MAAGCQRPSWVDPAAGGGAAARSSPSSRDWMPLDPAPRADRAPQRPGAPDPESRPPQGDLHPPSEVERHRFPWLTGDEPVRALSGAIDVPPGFERIALSENSFGHWLRDLPLRPPGATVRAYDGRDLLSANDPRVAAVAELDVSPVDLQQCADSVIRLHAEWRWARGDRDEIGYHFLSGDYATFGRYAAGERPQVDGARVRWAAVAPANPSRASFRSYLDMVFNYASTISLALRQDAIERAEAMPGDFVVLPGGPGHAILILDVARDARGRRVALLGQGFMPAQDFHVLSSGETLAQGDGKPNDSVIAPWFSLEAEAIDTPFWPQPFPWSSLRRFAER
jgi:hypothetical protein